MGPKMIQSEKDGGGLSLTLEHYKDETLPDTCVVSVNLVFSNYAFQFI